MMKKFMARTTAIAMAAAMLLAGCGGNSAPQGDGEQANGDVPVGQPGQWK